MYVLPNAHNYARFITHVLSNTHVRYVPQYIRCLISTRLLVCTINLVRAEVCFATCGTAESVTDLVPGSQVVDQCRFLSEDLVAELTHELQENIQNVSQAAQLGKTGVLVMPVFFIQFLFTLYFICVNADTKMSTTRHAEHPQQPLT